MNDRLLRACRREPVDATPIWIMRQAGRYLPEYRKVRERCSMLEAVKTPEIAVEITLQPVRRFALDAAIIFSDILPPLESMGVEVEFSQGDGPRILQPVREASDVQALRVPAAEEIAPYTQAAIALAARELGGRIPLIGFAGAPFTLAGYLVEGGGSRDYARAKGLMYAEPGVWHALMERLSQMVSRYLGAQVKAGAQAVQIFDSWVGVLSPADYREFVLPHLQRLVQAVLPLDVPVIYFSTGTAGMLKTVREVGASVFGVDWRVDLGAAWEELGAEVAVQGNLDPLALFAPLPALQRQAAYVLDQAAGRPGHIFNLGHGVLPQTEPEQVGALVDFVHEYRAGGRPSA